jgi:hypothetical protein
MYASLHLQIQRNTVTSHYVTQVVMGAVKFRLYFKAAYTLFAELCVMLQSRSVTGSLKLIGCFYDCPFKSV